MRFSMWAAVDFLVQPARRALESLQLSRSAPPSELPCGSSNGARNGLETTQETEQTVLWYRRSRKGL
jgi:hypothetical protein